MTTTTATATKPFVNHPLPVLISCRVRLNESQREALKEAYHRAEAAAAPSTGARIGGSFVKTETSYGTKNLLPRIVFADIVASRDSIALTALLQLQRDLGVEVITKAEVEEACKGYADYVFSEQAGK